MLLRYLSVCAILLCTCLDSFTQNISGIINTYTAVNLINNNVLTVASSAGFAPGDKVLLIQMQGATINTTNSAQFGTITNYGDAGHHEFNYVTAVNGNQITLQGKPCYTYTISGKVQLIRVPVYNSPTVSGLLTCAPWNGTTGGVLAFEATGTITMNANMDVTGNGFRGGNAATSYFDCNDAVYAANAAANDGGKKGEGIAAYIVGLDGSRAPQANGGGGSMRGNPGAGGGSNFGAGGRGGDIWSGCGFAGVWGMGGNNLSINSGRAFMGGGGGGGYGDNGQPVTAGANGGGIVMISAPTISGNGFAINARGGSVAGNTNDEGAGAGGAGGAVYLWCNNFTTATNVNVNGGTGGNTLNIIFSGNCHGPGGGGGGGYAYFTAGFVPGNVVVNSAGGASGLVLHNGPCFNQPFNAAPGAPGSNLYQLPPQTISFPPPLLQNDTIVCPNVFVMLQTTFNYPSYTWNNGTHNPTLVTYGAGTYWVEVPDGCGGVRRDTMNLGNINVSVSLPNDTAICQGDSVFLDAGPGFIFYQWNNVPGNPGSVQSVWVSQPGQYSVEVVNPIGCVARDTMVVLNFLPPAVVNLGPDTSFCQGQSVTFNAGPGFASYTWQNNSTNQTFTANSVGTYYVTVTSNTGCSGSDTVKVLNVWTAPQVNLGPDVSVCPDSSVTLNAGPNYSSYTWSNNSSNQTLTTNVPGNYSVTVVDNHGCSGTDNITISNYPSGSVSLGADVTLCQGQTVTFTPGNGYSGYVWQDFSTNSSFTASQVGQYYVFVLDPNGCPAGDTVNITNIFPPPVIDIGPDQSFCQGTTYNINAGAGYTSYVWQNNGTTQTFAATNAGTYYVTVTDVNGCQGSDTMRVVQVYPLPQFSLGPNFTLCPGNTAVIEPDNLNFPQMVWQDGSTNSSITVADTGTYSLTVTDNNGCQNTRFVVVKFLCPTSLYIPNAFTPNLDPNNDLFMAYGTNIRGFTMDIFNRWGEKLYTIPNIDSGWDGVHNGSPVPIGHYAYRVTYVDFNTTEEHKVIGSFSVIR